MKIVEYYRKELQRAAWRIQYKAKKQKKEIPMEYLPTSHSSQFTENSENKARAVMGEVGEVESAEHELNTK